MSKLLFFSMGSGSSGNCYYLGTEQRGLLIDAGISVNAIKRGLKQYGLDFPNIWGLLITHDHTDHVKSVGALQRKYHIPVYVTNEAYAGILHNRNVIDKPEGSKPIRKGETFSIADFTIQSFPVSHDASDCVGYSIRYEGRQFTIATDLGYIGMEAAEHIAHANFLVIEANYDETMLRNGPYPYRLKARVSSHTGHLCNDHTARFLADNWHDDLSHIFLCHLSAENNRPDIARDTVLNELTKKGIVPQLVEPLKRTELSPLYVLIDE